MEVQALVQVLMSARALDLAVQGQALEPMLGQLLAKVGVESPKVHECDSLALALLKAKVSVRFKLSK